MDGEAKGYMERQLLLTSTKQLPK
jgi:hypothetical protein